MLKTVGKYELLVVPRSMFVVDGTILHCQLKSSLMGILEKLPEGNESRKNVSCQPKDDIKGESGNQGNQSDDSVRDPGVKVAPEDAMAKVQSLDKAEDIKDCIQWADHFINCIISSITMWMKCASYLTGTLCLCL